MPQRHRSLPFAVRRRSLRALALAGPLFSLPILGLVEENVSYAQSTRGELAGNVTDSTGAAVAGATVTATNDATKGTSVALSTSVGAYRFTALPIGVYTITVTAPGFQTSTSTGVQVQINTTSSLNITMSVGSVSDVVTVDASGAQIQTESSDIGGTISDREIVELPLALGGVSQFRSAENFVFLVPGTTGPGAGTGNTLNNNGVFFGKISGGQDYGAEVLLDGASIQRSENGSSFDETSPSVEAMQEFKVTTSTPTAEFGRSTAGFESFATKNGTNAFHGTAFDINVNTVYNANGWFQNGLLKQCAPGDTACVAQYKRGVNLKNDYGGTLGGPVWIPHIYNGHDKTFFFFAWEQFKQQIAGTGVSTVPTAAERTGDFSSVLGGPVPGITNPCTGAPVLQNQIFDPATTSTTVTATNPLGTPCRLPFAGNVIPAGRLSAAAQALAKQLPLPNAAGVSNGQYGGSRYNYVVQQSYPLRNTTMTIRIDQTIGEKSKIFASYSSRDNVRQGVNNLPLPLSGFTPQNFVTHYSRAGWDYTFTPNLLNHLNLGYNRTNSFNYAQTLGGTNYAQQAGIANVVGNAFPVLNFDALDNYTTLGDGSNGDNVDNGIRVNDSVNWVKGRNSFKFGIDFRHQAYSTILKSIPTFNFERSETDYARAATPQQYSGNSYASFLLGAPDSTFQNAYIHTPRWLSHYVGGFFQDDFKATQNLTLNIGLRYDVDVPRHEAANDTSNFSFTAPDANANGLPGALIFGATCHCNSKWASTYFKDIAPRLGFAYSPPNSNGKTVLRGGGALLYGPLLYGDFGGSMSAGYTVPDNQQSPDGFTPAYQLDAGVPSSFPTKPNLDPAQFDTGVFQHIGSEYISPGMGRPSVTYNWSLEVQQEFARNLIGSIGYIGQEAQNLRSSLQNINNIPLQDFRYGDHLNDGLAGGQVVDGIAAPYPTFPTTGQVYRALRPFPQYDYIATDCCLQNVGHSSYNALVTSLKQSTRFGLTFQASYTWQKNLTDADSALENNQPNLQQDQDVFNHRLEKSVSVQNIPNTFVVNYLYALPFGKGRAFLNHGTVTNLLVGGWTLGGIQRYQSGQPISFGCATGIPGYQNCIRFSKGPAPFETAAHKNNKLHANQFNGESWFNPAYTPGVTSFGQSAFVDHNDESKGLRTPFAPFALGTGIDRVTSNVTTPLWKQEDFSVLKDFQIKEGVAFQLKLEILDAFNRHNFNLPDIEPNDGAFGTPTLASGTSLGPRNMQVTGRINF